ncbi:hypothetical protein VMCG_09915 [Cytospora schulzeri]|uniref:BTB domain-containing protein n=1 Tax=Cytospora schulzeri TaxID=448051 RepID=A0A423VE07_9PEZI|nr:hypothetical protein VMCG_09915 [Valsa malicola]
MVSQPDHSSTSGSGGTLTIRGPSSVVGTSSTTGARHRSSRRSHHYNRSYAGGTSYVPQNEFPWFSHSGDVEIVVRVPSGHENRYLLHRHTLTRCSGFFEASTSEPWSKAVDVLDLPTLPAPLGTRSTGASTSELGRIGEEDGARGVVGGGSAAVASRANMGTPRKRWRYELDYGKGGDDIPMLVQKPENSSGSNNSGSSNNNNNKNNTNGTSSTTTTTSIFGGGSSSTTSNPGRTKHSHSHSTSRDFFRSVANLSMPSHSSSQHHNQYTLPPTNNTTTTGNLPPPTAEDQDTLRDYDNLFRIMYNFSPVLDGINIADAYVQCKSLLTIADQYDALSVVGPRVDHHLLQFQSRLWKQIAKYPISYLRLGYLARSKVIFQEALIHVVGQWPAGERSLRNSMPESVLDIIEDKVDELEETVARVEGRLFRLNLTTRSGERVTPATGYLDWLAVSLFRQWLADNTTPAPPLPPPPPPPPDRRSMVHNGGTRARNNSASNPSALVPNNNNNNNNTMIPPVPPLASLGRTYRTLGNMSGSAGGYLGHDECKRFLKLTPEMYSRDNLRRFEKRVDELKAMAREIVRPLMGSGLELDMGGGSRAAEGIGYLTCMRVGDRDLPWPE